ncbi:putative ABC multidrug transporter [Aspergillus affinis]|uniref:putative ABC multidrug transporter n=1 Tax=Aspergillus affinis TaxID=1070780 RepID=UPI0022FE669D|nr:ATP-binding cassette transporter [Aspergillus affinis]KAI9043612.1 ATP-binding cassette transporter [Aspergillus affinis]
MSDDQDEDNLLKDATHSSATVYGPTVHRSSTVRIETDEIANLKRIASQHSQRSKRRSSVHPCTVSTAGDGDSLGRITDNDPAINPQGPEFDLEKWLKWVIKGARENGMSSSRAGIVFKNLNVSGSGAALKLQETVTSMFSIPTQVSEAWRQRRSPPKLILKDFNGLLASGQLLLVLGRPGAGCSTFLKTLCGEVYGLDVDKKSVLHYNGVSQSRMMKEFKGEVVYNQEIDKHFPHLTVGQTLEFAAAARMSSRRLQGASREESAKHLTQVIMAVLGLSHTYNTKVGNDFIRGVSGGERKRVSIAEMALANAPLAAWDNSTRGLDSATALKFVESLRIFADLAGSAHAVAAYQASQAIYEAFDKVTVLYEGRQIFFGSATTAKPFFEEQGWECPARQTTGDFLASVTNPQERRARQGMEARVPRTPQEFETYWLQSREYHQLQAEIAQYERSHPSPDDKGAGAQFQERKLQVQAKHTRPGSPYLISVPMQIKLTTKRAYQRLWNDRTSTISTIISNIMMALIVGSVFYGSQDTTAGFASKGATLFYAVLLNALMAMSEINNLYAQRPIIEKHASYAFYHPAAEAIAGVVSDIPVKFALAVAFNITMYFMTNLRREASQFFIYFLHTFIVMFVMSAVFRTIGAATKTIAQAMGIGGVMILALIVYTGYVLPVPSMHPWFDWIHWINPVYYAFEVLIANEFHGRDFPCAQLVPPTANRSGRSFTCSSSGSEAGSLTVSGDSYIMANYSYSYGHVWRNFGILIAFLVAFMAIFFLASELNSSTASMAEALVFRRGHAPAALRERPRKHAKDVETSMKLESVKSPTEELDTRVTIPPQTDIFTWRDICYDIEIKGEPRRLLDHVSGWVKPGTLTALMGVSGAGKTTLLDVLAQRTSMGVITGDMFVNGRTLDVSFQRKTGYVQQQDLHLDTATVRESLRFSALLRQPASVSTKEKYDYIEEVIAMLNMEEFAEAVVGVPGQGLNVEQRKLLTIGVELAAKPKLLLFLDEPTSGLDSQSSWAICSFLRKLAHSGQAVLCTIHQPSAMLFQQFDQLLFLAKGGKTAYFGPIGAQSRTLLDYFQSNGARNCADDENPAEYMIEVVNEGANSRGQSWFDVWSQSSESQSIQTEINRIHAEQAAKPQESSDDRASQSEFAAPLWMQLYVVTRRTFQQYWRMPEYIVSKWGLAIMAGLFIGFSFYDAKQSLQGMQVLIFSLFMICSIFASVVQQVMPVFVTQRALYEVRERPSKAYSWKAFLIANIIVEIPYQILSGILTFACYYYAVVGDGQTSDRQVLVLLFCIQYYVYASTFAHMIIAAIEDAITGSAIVVLLFSMSLTFCGVMQPQSALPGFWMFMYRVSPFTYWIGGMAATQLHGRQVVCSTEELTIFDPPSGQTCQQYLGGMLEAAGGQLMNPDATKDCNYCSLSVADEYMASVGIYWTDRWRNFGLLWVFVVFNIFMATVLYYLFRIRRWSPGMLLEKVAKK